MEEESLKGRRTGIGRCVQGRVGEDVKGMSGWWTSDGMTRSIREAKVKRARNWKWRRCPQGYGMGGGEITAGKCAGAVGYDDRRYVLCSVTQCYAVLRSVTWHYAASHNVTRRYMALRSVTPRPPRSPAKKVEKKGGNRRIS